MKRGTLILKIALILIGALVLAVCVMLLPGANFLRETDPGPDYLQYFVFYLYATAIPFYFALYQAYKILRYIDGGNAFSDLSLRALKRIKNCAAAISIMYFAASPFFLYAAEADDAPGILAFGLLLAFVAFIIAVFAAILQKLLKDSMDRKPEPPVRKGANNE